MVANGEADQEEVMMADLETILGDDARRSAGCHHAFRECGVERGDEMSIFATNVRLTTEGSSEAELATRTAVDLGQQTNLKLHMIHALDLVPTAALPGSDRS
jgi:hypothetical protein